ncbi:type IV pilus biogenesis/stability protein PilW [Brumicola nitratireducens]|uniref:ATP-dependent protease La n=1 Tax=Glaciecola nitratireducens (strain JCM 12485 / KCTC 12276 / FR1064) TaxID=1085623 RepID=G4QK37_GLANF|nr:type IV pilus biogenesis/stability protein PilW [Glaciecola nitratireducens]AEP29159.1 ATP-dependent protease La [Glaciecola nitratireducens FR1064]
MLKKSVAAIVLCSLLSACVTEPRDPDFAGADAINTDAAAKNRVSLGLTYLNNGNFSQAKANLDKALNFAPKSADAHFAMAYYYQQVDELALTEEYYLKALKLAPENPNIINSYGAFLCEQGRYEKAKSYFLKAVSSKSYVSTAETYENLAICAVDQGKTDEAVGFFESALNHQPTRGKSLFFLAQLQKEQGNYGEAKKTLWKYDRVSRVSPESLWLSYEIAQGLSDTEAALGYGELMKSMFPEHPNTALFKKQMGKFQPVATVKNKRAALAVPPAVQANTQAEVAVTVDEPLNAVENDQSASVEAPSLVKVNKKIKTLAPDAAENKVEEQVQQKVIENAPSLDEAAKREAELEAALSADFNAVSDESASIDGTIEKVDETLATADKAAETTVEQTQDKATQQIDEAASANASYHVVLPKENLYRISLRYNVKMKYLMQWNNLDDSSAIRVGMKLRVKDPKNND